jgi:hypothetical protein
MKMKKKIFGGIAALSIAIAAAFNMSLGTSNNALSSVSLNDIEAEADCEIKKGGSVKLLCSGSGFCTVSYMGYTLTCTGQQQ